MACGKLDLSGIPPEKRRQMSRQTDDDLIFPDTKAEKTLNLRKSNLLSKKPKNTTDQQTDLIFRDTVLNRD
jgi:hypothetical protein